ncbi:hypothetical protein AVEN_141487-1 [Araneus ventricosus]|uniref:Lipase domain-containing protein n=1 Tax=Araneus ventricosus TaxID=182803 RepID=A0A4Y2WFC2_ARAVE|nr:hypothetical protein AVEN_141487-1 [Araneus ventricosus]
MVIRVGEDSHQDPGNELADNFAKLASIEGEGMNIPYPYSSVKFTLKEKLLEDWQIYNGAYETASGNRIRVQTTLDKIFCNHFITIEYFTNSLKGNCRFVATECQSYLDFKKGHCLSHIKAEMGFFTKMINGIPSMAMFYLTTLESPPYCKGENNSS